METRQTSGGFLQVKDLKFRDYEIRCQVWTEQQSDKSVVHAKKKKAG